MEKKIVSIVIVARDVNGKLLKCLDSIKAQTYKDIEIIIETEGDIVTARRRGVERAKGKYICFVDGDQILPSNCIQLCVESCDYKSLKWYDGGVWTERGLYHDTFCEKIIDYDKELFHEDGDDDPIYGAAEPRFFRAEFVKKIDWSKLPPVTFELSMINKQIKDMGAKITWVPVKVYHHEPRTFRELFKKFFRYGYYYIPSLKYNRQLVLNHSKPRRVYFKFKALRHPALYVGLWLHYLVKAIAALGGAIWYLLSAVGRGKMLLI